MVDTVTRIYYSYNFSCSLYCIIFKIDYISLILFLFSAKYKYLLNLINIRSHLDDGSDIKLSVKLTGA